MKTAEEHIAEICAGFAGVEPLDALVRTRKIAVPLLEDLGYRLGRESEPSAANSVFILASEIEKRLTALALSVAEEEEEEEQETRRFP